MNETIKNLLISLSCVVANFSGIAIVAKCLIAKWKRISDDNEITKKEIKSAKDELVRNYKKMNELNDNIQWLTQSNENLKLELRGVKHHAESHKKN